MSRSAELRVAAGAAACCLVLAGPAAAQTPTPSVTGSESPAPGAVGSDPVAVEARDIVIDARDLIVTVESLDGSFGQSESSTEVRITLAADVLFAFDRADLSPRARARLAAAAKVIAERAKGAVRIDGYTDSKGSDSYNLALSRRRAQAVQRALERLLPGRSVRFVSRGHGESNPVAANTANGRDNPKGRARNRRVEVSFPK